MLKNNFYITVFNISGSKITNIVRNRENPTLCVTLSLPKSLIFIYLLEAGILQLVRIWFRSGVINKYRLKTKDDTNTLIRTLPFIYSSFPVFIHYLSQTLVKFRTGVFPCPSSLVDKDIKILNGVITFCRNVSLCNLVYVL